MRSKIFIWYWVYWSVILRVEVFISCGFLGVFFSVVCACVDISRGTMCFEK